MGYISALTYYLSLLLLASTLTSAVYKKEREAGRLSVPGGGECPDTQRRICCHYEVQCVPRGGK